MEKHKSALAIGRFKPLHNGTAALLESLCENADKAVIGIGSCNKYNLRNPFTAEESKEMIDAFLSKKASNYSITYLPDFAHIPEFSDGQRWREHVLEQCRGIEYLVSGNPYVCELLKNDYEIIHPNLIIPAEKQITIRATQVRFEMALRGNWQSLVPEEVAQYIEQNKLDERFIKEFGLETLVKTIDENHLRFWGELYEKYPEFFPELVQERRYTSET